MKRLNIDKLDEETFNRLSVQARKHRHTLEEEALNILRKAMQTSKAKDISSVRAGDFALRLFGPDNGIELDLQRSPGAYEALDLSK